MIAAFAPATVSNVGCGFDLLGFALDAPGEVIVVAPSAGPGVHIAAVHGRDAALIPQQPTRNTAAVAASALLDRLGIERGIDLTIHRSIPVAGGIGSSGASAVAAVVAVNELLGRPASMATLFESAMDGERAAVGSAHPDNVAPALYGGFVLARHDRRFEVVPLPVPPGLSCAVAHPHLQIETREARRVLGDTVALPDAVRQASNLGSLVSALFRGDLELLSRSLVDAIAEPRRAALVPWLRDVQRAARDAGALGAGLSGSGPSVFALAATPEAAHEAGAAMMRAFQAAGLGEGAEVWTGPVGAPGARLVTAGSPT